MQQRGAGTTANLLYWSVAVALAGLLFGFDTAVISGADQPIQALWETSDLFHGAFIMSSARSWEIFPATGTAANSL